MTSLALIAGTLLIIRLIAVYKLSNVLKVQIRLLKKPIDAEVWEFRRSLHYMTIALMVGNILPIILDSLVIADELDLISHYRGSAFLTAYAISNALTMLIAVIMISRMYGLANVRSKK